MSPLQAKILVNQTLYSYLFSLEGKPYDLAVVSRLTNKLIRDLRFQGFIIYSPTGEVVNSVKFHKVHDEIQITLHHFEEDSYENEDSDHDLD